MKQNQTAPIAVLDSGLGGLTVLRELRTLMPQEDYIYYGDTAHAPYGEKNVEEVRRLVLDCARLLLEEMGAKTLVVACNTATSAAIDQLRQLYPDRPPIGMEPALKPAARSGQHPKVLVMATPITLREQKFQRLLHNYDQQAEVRPVPCPGLAEMIEGGTLDGPELRELLEQLLTDVRTPPPDALVLGCTHYPLVEKSILEVLGRPVKVFQGGPGTARETRRRLEEAGLLRQDGVGGLRFFNSLQGEAALAWNGLAERLFWRAMKSK